MGEEYREIDIEDLPYDLVPVAQLMGINLFIDFCDKFGGANFYLPSKKSILRSSRNKKILERYNGKNSKELAKEFGITEMHLKAIIRKNI